MAAGTRWFFRRDITLCASLLILLLSGPALGDAAKVTWSDTSRDVYVDGDLEVGAIVLSARGSDEHGPAFAVLSYRTERAFVVDLDSLDVSLRPLDRFTLTAAGAVSTRASESRKDGRATRVRDRTSTHYLLTAGGHTLLVAPHQGPVGVIAPEELFEAAPTWQRRVEAYEPDAEAIAALSNHDRDLEVTVALGTWCGDSRNYVPKLIKSLESAGNPRLQLELVGIGRGFGDPADVILGEAITNVPTVIVREAGEEIGRIVETPAGSSIEADLATILTQAQPPHPGRWSRQEKVAQGRYVFRDSEDLEIGDESWELFDTEEGGTLLHAEVAREGYDLEIWHRRNAEGASEFVELTRLQGDERTRTRIWINGASLRALTRGNTTGIVEQKLEVPPGTRFLTPSAADAGFDWARLGQHVSSATAKAFVLSAERPSGGKLIDVHSAAAGNDTLVTGAGEIKARCFDSHVAGDSHRWWIEDEIGVPVRGVAEGREIVTLESFEVLPRDDGERVAERH